MSPPVVGTMLALCLVYFLRDEGGAEAWKVPLSLYSPTSTQSALSGPLPTSPSSSSVQKTPALAVTAVAIEDGRCGVYGVFTWLSSDTETSQPCGHCGGSFGHNALVYRWRSFKTVLGCHQYITLHEHCVLDYSEAQGCVSTTLKGIDDLVSTAPPVGCDYVLESLFSIQDDLVRLDTFSLDEVSPIGDCKGDKSNALGDDVEGVPEPEHMS